MHSEAAEFSLSVTYPQPRQVTALQTPALPNVPTIAQIRTLAKVMATGVAGPVVDLSGGLRHYFAPGMYGRELFIPADRMVVGQQHRFEHLVQLMSGEATVWTDKGMERITGPRTWVSPAGVQRALVTHTDCVFFTFHTNPTDCTDVAQIERDIVIPQPALGQDTPALPDFTDALQGIYA